MNKSITKIKINENISIYQNNVMENNTIIFEHDHHTIIVDPSFYAEEVFRNFNNKKIIVILTHTHFDHTGNIDIILKYTSKIFLSEKAKKIIDEIKNKNDLRMLFFGRQGIIDSSKFTFLSDKQEIFDLKIYLTPGHSHDSMCILHNDVIITGDHLFIYDIGATSFPFSNTFEMDESLIKIRKILEKNKNKLVIPGHGEWKKAKYVLENNNYLKTNS